MKVSTRWSCFFPSCAKSKKKKVKQKAKLESRNQMLGKFSTPFSLGLYGDNNCQLLGFCWPHISYSCFFFFFLFLILFLSVYMHILKIYELHDFFNKDVKDYKHHKLNASIFTCCICVCYEGQYLKENQHYQSCVLHWSFQL